MIKTQADAQARIMELEQQLGISPTVMTQADAQAKMEELNKSLSALPMTIQEFSKMRKADADRSFTDKALAFGSTIAEGFKELGKQGIEATEESEGLLDLDAYGDIIDIGSKDFARFAKTIGGVIMDEFGHTNQEELVREYMRYKDNFDYYQKVRPAMLESDEIEYKKLTDFGSNFIDPFMIFPVAKVGTFATKTTLKGVQKGLTAGANLSRSQGMVNVAKGARGASRAVQKLERGVDIAGKIGAYPTEMASKLVGVGLRKGIKGTALGLGVGLKTIGAIGSGTAKVASAPRKIIEAGVNKVSKGAKDLGGVTLGGQVVGGVTGSIPFAMELGITEGVGLIAKKLGKGFGEVMTTLAQPASNKRFLYRVATNPKLDSKTRKLAMYAYNYNMTTIGDGLFNMLVNGLSIGAINAGFAGLAEENAEGMGRAFGAGLLAGGIIPSGQQGMRAGKSDASRDMKSIDNHMKLRMTEDQRTAFKKMPKPAQVMLATLQEAGIGAPKFEVMESKAYLEMLNATLREQGKPELTEAPRGHFDPVRRTFFVNESKLPQSSAVAMETIAHETGHDFLYQMLGDNPYMLQLLLENYKTSKEDGVPFYFEFDNDGNPIGEPVYLNQMAVSIRDDYDMKQRGKPATLEDVQQGLASREGEMIGGIKLGNDARRLAQEIGADQFAMMFTKDPNAFNHFHPKLRRVLIDSSRRLLTVLGMAEPMTGNPLNNPISRVQLNNPALRRLYENYGRARAIELDEKGKLANDGLLIKPKDGQTGEDRFLELMEGNKEFQSSGLSLTEAKNLRLTNKNLQREIKNLKNLYKDDPQDTWSVRMGRLIGKRLTPDLRAIFTRNDPFQNVATIIDALQQAIDQGVEIVFGYRSGTKGKYQNPFKIRNVAIFGWEVSGNSLKVQGYDQSIIRHNIQVLVENGYIKKENIKDFERQLAEQGQVALADPEGRINPDGGAENTLMTAVFGLKQSIDSIRSEGLKELLENGKLKNSFKMYDVEALAGVARGRRKAFTFNYDNIKNNYNPFRQGDDPLFMPLEVQEGSPASPFRRRSAGNKITNTRNFKNSVHMKDGSRLSGVFDNDTQDPFIGFDKNGEAFSIRREFVKPEDIAGSKDGDKMADMIREELENKSIYPLYKNPKQAIDQGTHGTVVQKGIKIDQKLSDLLFSPASAAYFDAGFSPDTYVGKVGFPMMADRMKTTPHVARDGTEFELRGGPDHPDMPINAGKIGWASMAGSQATQLQNAINSTDGVGLVVLMNEDAVASNRSFARIMIHELKHDHKTNKEARKILPKKIKEASKAVRVWAKKEGKKSLMKFDVKTLEDIEAIYPDLSFEVRKLLFTKIADITYKRKVGGFFWRDLMRDIITYKNEDGYRTGDVVKVIKFEQGDSIVKLEDLDIPPDPTYDTSFRGTSISNIKGRVSIFQIMRDAFDLIAEETGKEGRTMDAENKVGRNAFRTVQMRALTDKRFHQELSPSSLDPRVYDPIKFSDKSGPERKSLEVRQAENMFMPSSDRDPVLMESAQLVKEGKMTPAERSKLVNEIRPVQPYTEIPEPTTVDDMQMALGKKGADETGKSLVKAPQQLEKGTPVGVRLDIPSWNRHGKWVITVHEAQGGFTAGKVIGYDNVSKVEDAFFGSAEKKSLTIATGKAKQPIGVYKGKYVPIDTAQAKAIADKALNDPAWTQVGFDPTRHSYFYDRKTMQPVVSAQEVIQIGPVVLAKNALKGNPNDFLFAPNTGDINRMSPRLPSNQFMNPAVTRSIATSSELDRFRN